MARLVDSGSCSGLLGFGAVVRLTFSTHDLAGSFFQEEAVSSAWTSTLHPLDGSTWAGTPPRSPRPVTTQGPSRISDPSLPGLDKGHLDTATAFRIAGAMPRLDKQHLATTALLTRPRRSSESARVPRRNCPPAGCRPPPPPSPAETETAQPPPGHARGADSAARAVNDKAPAKFDGGLKLRIHNPHEPILARLDRGTTNFDGLQAAYGGFPEPWTRGCRSGVHAHGTRWQGT